MDQNPDSLKLLRDKNKTLTQDYFKWVKERKDLVDKINEIKTPPLREYANFDPDWELKLFSSLKDELNHLSLKELFSYSLIMEEHAQAKDLTYYPSWSEKTHACGDSILSQINPILLFISRPRDYKNLVWNESWMSLKSHLSNLE